MSARIFALMPHQPSDQLSHQGLLWRREFGLPGVDDPRRQLREAVDVPEAILERTLSVWENFGSVCADITRHVLMRPMKHANWRSWFARIAVSAGAFAAYAPLLTLGRLYVTDDAFTSDIFNGELPGRVLIGQLLAKGQAPVWSSSLCSGVPLSTGVLEPLSLGLFATMAPARALCLLVIVLLLVAAHGAFGLARRLGADRSGAVLAGIAYAGSGYMATQLKHLAIVSTVVWLPWGLLMLDRAIASKPVRPLGSDAVPAPSPSVLGRVRDVAIFGLIYAEQVASGFPQSAYICGLVYAGWSAWLLLGLKGRVGHIALRLVLGASLALAAALAAMSGSTGLLPLSELGSLSDRRQAPSWEFASMLPYSFSDALNFLSPYANGNVADGTYHADGLFWENYGYVGLATFVLAVWAILRGARRPRVTLLFILAGLAFLMVLGPRTPAYQFAWAHLPGMAQFRFPTRFLFVVDLAVSVLGGLGLGLLRADLARVVPRRALRTPQILSYLIVLGTAWDLSVSQSQQNPFVRASEWLAAPKILAAIGKPAQELRLFSPLHDYFHRVANQQARGWADLTPYFELREAMAPNTGVYWGVSAADCYSGIAPSWRVDVWGDHSRAGLVVPSMMRLAHNRIQVSRSFATLLGGYGVTHVVTPFPIIGAPMKEIPNAGPMHLYELDGKRCRIVPFARVVRDNREAAAALLQPGFDPNQEILLQDGAGAGASNADSPGTVIDTKGDATIVEETSRYLRLNVSAPRGGFLLLSDTYYPGWHAKVDGVETSIFRANISVRAVQLPPGARTVEFRYDASPFWKGLTITAVAVFLLLLWLALAIHFDRRGRRERSGEMSAIE
jgi:hypothetical protein